jgi:hypothetical protein
VVEFSRRARADLSGAAAMSGEVTEARSRIMRMVDVRRAVPSRITRAGRAALAASLLLLLAMQQPASSAAEPPGEGATPTIQDPVPAPTAAAPAGAVPIDRNEPMRKSRSAVLEAARWLALHQAPHGYWDSDGFGRGCGECEQRGQPLNDPGVTALAVMALIEAERLGDSQAAPGIDRASSYLVAIQDSEDGGLGSKAGQHFMYGHALATLALGKLEARKREPARGKALQKAADFLARSRNPYRGWRYAYPPDGDNDASTTAFALLALEQAMEVGVAVHAQAVDDGGKYLDDMRDPTNGRVGYHERGSLSAREPDDMEVWPADQVEAITAAALHVATEQGRSLEDHLQLRAASTSSS